VLYLPQAFGLGVNMDIYARPEHGGHRVHRTHDGFLVHWPTGTVQYPSARALIRALVNQTPVVTPDLYDPHWTFNRYFKLGKHSPMGDYTGNILDGMHAPRIHVTRKHRTLGVDLRARGHEVRKLFYAGFARRALKYGYDPDEVLQEVFAGILIRNQGKCPFDPEKSSFGHYVHMVCGCILSNYHRKHGRVSAAESTGGWDADGNDCDVALLDIMHTPANQEHVVGLEDALNALESAIKTSNHKNSALALEILPMISSGMTKTEIQREFPERRDIGGLVDFVRRVVRDVSHQDGA
jgi:hypothetical protein